MAKAQIHLCFLAKFIEKLKVGSWVRADIADITDIIDQIAGT